MYEALQLGIVLFTAEQTSTECSLCVHLALLGPGANSQSWQRNNLVWPLADNEPAGAKEMEFYSSTWSPGMVFITVHLQIYFLVKFLFHFWIVPFYITKIKLNPILTLKKGGSQKFPIHSFSFLPILVSTHLGNLMSLS